METDPSGDSILKELADEYKHVSKNPGLPSLEHIQLAIVSGWLNQHSGASLTSSWDMAKFLADLAADGLITLNA